MSHLFLCLRASVAMFVPSVQYLFFVSSCLRDNVCAIRSIFILCVFVPSWQCLRHPLNIYFLCLCAFVAMFAPSVKYIPFVSSCLRGNVCAICSIFIFCVFVPLWQCLCHPFNIYFLCLRAFVAMFVPSVKYLFFVS